MIKQPRAVETNSSLFENLELSQKSFFRDKKRGTTGGRGAVAEYDILQKHDIEVRAKEALNCKLSNLCRSEILIENKLEQSTKEMV